MLDAGLIAARALHYAAVMLLFGGALFPLYAYPLQPHPLLPHPLRPNPLRPHPLRNAPIPDRLQIWSGKLLFSASAAAFLTACLWFQLATAQMSGSLDAAMDPEALHAVLYDTAFGQVWSVRLGLSALLVAATGLTSLVSKSAPRRLLLTVLAAALLATLAGTGHTMLSDGMDHTLHIAADAAHLLAAGAWLGGLVSLGYVLTTEAETSRDVLTRFSGMGTIAVAVLVASGLINSWFLVGNVSNLFVTPYGRLLVVKLGIFTVMLALAAANRFWLVPALSIGARSADAASKRLRQHVLAEQVLGCLVILLVSVLGTLAPAVG